MDVSEVYTEDDGTLVTEASSLKSFSMDERFQHPETGDFIPNRKLKTRMENGRVIGWDVELNDGKPLFILND